MKPNSQSNIILNDKIKKKTSIEKKSKSIGLTCQTLDLGHEMKTTQ
jgi:hypothetical protein